MARTIILYHGQHISLFSIILNDVHFKTNQMEIIKVISILDAVLIYYNMIMYV